MVFLGGVFGPFLAPMAVTVIVASLASLAVAVCVTPATAVLLLRGLQPKPRAERWSPGWKADLWLPALDRPPLRGGPAGPGRARRDGARGRRDPAAGAPHRRAQFPRRPADRAFPSAALDLAGRHGPHGRRRLTEAGLSAPGVVAASETIGRDPTDFSARSTDQSDIEFDLRPDLSVADQERTQARLKTILAAYPGVAADIRTGLGPRQAAPGGRARPLRRQRLRLRSGPGRTKRRTGSPPGCAAWPGAGDVTVLAGPRAPSVRVDLDFHAAGDLRPVGRRRAGDRAGRLRGQDRGPGL